MMGRLAADQRMLFYPFNLDECIPQNHILCKINIFVAAALADLQKQLAGYYSHTGRPSTKARPATPATWPSK